MWDSKQFSCVNSLIPSNNLSKKYYYYSHFTNEESEIERG